MKLAFTVLYPHAVKSNINIQKIMEYDIGGRWVYSWCVGSPDGMERVLRMASESAVVVFSRSGCCMCHAVKRLLCGMGVNPRVYELDRHPFGKDMERALMTLLRSSSSFSVSTASSTLPVIFIGGNLVGAIDSVLASHINGSLVPLLKQAGALWL